MWPENHSSAQRHRSRSEAYSGDRARDKMVLGSYQLFLYYLAVLVSVLGVLALFRGRELVEGRCQALDLLDTVLVSSRRLGVLDFPFLLTYLRRGFIAVSL